MHKLIAFLIFICATTSQALIIYGVDSNGNQTDPGIGTIWGSVVEIARPTELHNASAVHLGNGHFITAKHVDAIVGTQTKQVKINGTTYNLDSSFGDYGVQLVETLPTVSGSVDMKLFKVDNAPILPFITLNTNSDDRNQSAYLVGYGWGKGSAIPNQGWYWSSNEIVKRWGLTEINDSSPPETLTSDFRASYGINSAALSLGDSGSGMFEFQDGQWTLAGLSVDVRTMNASYYNLGDTIPANPDWSSYVRISNYAGAINNAIPEPSVFLLVCLGCLLLLYSRIWCSKATLLILSSIILQQSHAQIVTELDSNAKMFITQCNANVISTVVNAALIPFVTSGLNSPYDLAFDKAGNMYAVNYFGNSVSKISPTGAISTYATGLHGPAGLAFDNIGILYVSNLNNNTISKVYQDGRVEDFVTVLGPASLAFDASGTLFVANLTASTNGTQISSITNNGTVTLFADNISSPNGLAFDASGDLYVSNLHARSITRITPSGTASIFATGSALGGPAQLAFDSTGTLFVANFDINTIAQVLSDGTASKYLDAPGGPVGLAFTPVPETSTIKLLLLATIGVLANNLARGRIKKRQFRFNAQKGAGAR